jgi:hypothetical protein
MTENGYLIWFIAMAIMTIFVLTVGTLAAADMFARERREEDATQEQLEGDAQAPRPMQAAASPEHLEHAEQSTLQRPHRPAA